MIEGRKVFGNIIKYIKMGASSNFGNMFSVLGASLFLPFLPMAPIQVLTNNLLYDFSQTADPDRQCRRGISRPAAPLGHRQHLQVHGLHRADQLDLRLRDLRHDAVRLRCAGPIPPLFQTGWFVESLLTQTLIIHIIRTARIPFIAMRIILLRVACASLRDNFFTPFDDNDRCQNRHCPVARSSPVIVTGS